MDQLATKAETDSSMDLEKLLNYRVQRLAAKMTLITSREVLAGSGVHIGEWRLLCLLQEYGQANHTTISQKLPLDPGRTSRLLKAAERKGLVRRASEPKDGRASIFALSASAIEIHEKLWPRANGVAEDFHNEFEVRELEQLNELLDRAIAYANKRISE